MSTPTEPNSADRALAEKLARMVAGDIDKALTKLFGSVGPDFVDKIVADQVNIFAPWIAAHREEARRETERLDQLILEFGAMQTGLTLKRVTEGVPADSTMFTNVRAGLDAKRALRPEALSKEVIKLPPFEPYTPPITPGQTVPPNDTKSAGGTTSPEAKGGA